jgi:hypothetical protein
MKLTTANLKQIIKEELEAVMQEGYTDKEILSQQVINDFANEVINFTEFKEKINVIGLSSYAEEQAMKAGVEALERKKQGKNTPFGDYIPGKNAPQHGTYTDPLITTMKLSDEQKGRIQRIKKKFDDLADKLGSREAVYEKMIDVSKKAYLVRNERRALYKNTDEAKVDYTKATMPNSSAEAENVGDRVEKYLDALMVPEKKKSNWFSKFFSKK